MFLTPRKQRPEKAIIVITIQDVLIIRNKIHKQKSYYDTIFIEKLNDAINLLTNSWTLIWGSHFGHVCQMLPAAHLSFDPESIHFYNLFFDVKFVTIFLHLVIANRLQDLNLWLIQTPFLTLSYFGFIPDSYVSMSITSFGNFARFSQFRITINPGSRNCLNWDIIHWFNYWYRVSIGGRLF